MAIEFGSAPTVPNRAGWHGVRERFAGSRKVGARERAFFTEQLALMLESGVSLHTALETLSRHAESAALAALADELADDVANGKTFSHALSRHPKVFSRSYVNLVAASERGGFMHAVLNQILRMDERAAALRSATLAAFFYPALLLILSVAVVVFVLVAVFPKFGAMFTAIRSELPVSTRALMALSESVSAHWGYWIAGVLIAGLASSIWLMSERGRLMVDRLKLYAPALRNIFPQLYLIHSMRVIGLSLANGVNVVDALAACREVVGNRLFRRFLIDVERRVQEGAGISPAFRDADFTPPVVREMITTGEQTGSLARVMAKLADHYEDDLQKRLTKFSKLAEPLMLLVMGALVGILVSSLILPIFKLSRVVS